MNNRIRVLKSPCGRGKTRGYAFERILKQPGKYLFVTPQISLIDELEVEVKRTLANGRPSWSMPLFARINSLTPDAYSLACKTDAIAAHEEPDLPSFLHRVPNSGRVPDRLRLTLEHVIDSHTKVIATTHNQLWTLDPELVRDRVIIIDEIPNFFEFKIAPTVHWNDLTRSGYIKILPGDKVHVLDAGVERLADSSSLGDHIQDLLSFCAARDTFLADCGTTKRGAFHQINPEIFRAAQEVVLMGASETTGNLPEYLARNALQREFVAQSELPASLSIQPEACNNTDIVYLFEVESFGSLERLRNGPQGKLPRGQEHLTQSWAEELAEFLPRMFEEGGDLAGRTDYVAAINPEFVRRIEKTLDNEVEVVPDHEIGKGLDQEKIVSPGIRGENRWKKCGVMLWLAATRPSGDEVLTVQAIGAAAGTKREPDAIISARHVENMYQFIMRGVLRVDENALAKIVVLTSKDAEALKERIGARSVTQCYPPPPSAKKYNDRPRARGAKRKSKQAKLVAPDS